MPNMSHSRKWSWRGRSGGRRWERQTPRGFALRRAASNLTGGEDLDRQAGALRHWARDAASWCLDVPRQARPKVRRSAPALLGAPPLRVAWASWRLPLSLSRGTSFAAQPVRLDVGGEARGQTGGGALVVVQAGNRTRCARRANDFGDVGQVTSRAARSAPGGCRTGRR